MKLLRRIGMRAHDYGKDSMRTLLKLMEVDGYGTTQLALKKAIKGVDSLDIGLTDEVISSIIRAVKTSSCDISVFGAYLNYAHPD